MEKLPPKATLAEKEVMQLSMEEEKKIPRVSSSKYYKDSGEWESHKKLQRLGHYYDADGVLKRVKDDSGFQFTTQEDYEELASAIIEFVQEGLLKIYKLREVYLPLDAKKSSKGDKAVIYTTTDFETNPDKCLIIIQGKTPVRAGIWARAACINASLRIGSMYPYIERAVSSGCSIIILNPNDNFCSDGKTPIKKIANPQEHCRYVWENLIMKKCKAKKLYMIAFSNGGINANDLLTKYYKDFTKRVVALVIGDSVFGPIGKLKDYLQKHAIHIKGSIESLGTDITGKLKASFKTISAGTKDHSSICGVGIELCFSFLLKF